MSTIDRQRRLDLPPLVDGERLDRVTFHERYEAMPEGTRAELIDGVVAMMSPIGRGHSEISSLLNHWLNDYRTGLPGLKVMDNGTVLLDDRSEVEPDVALRVLPEYTGQSRREGAYVAGAPELVVEVAHSSRAKDLGPKFRDYQRAGVREYVVVAIEPECVYWFVRRGAELVPHTVGEDGLYRSEVFPGLWLDPAALFADDPGAVREAVRRGKETPEHAAFAVDLRARGLP